MGFTVGLRDYIKLVMKAAWEAIPLRKAADAITVAADAVTVATAAARAKRLKQQTSRKKLIRERNEG